jgi:hypothetical protein
METNFMPENTKKITKNNGFETFFSAQIENLRSLGGEFQMFPLPARPLRLPSTGPNSNIYKIRRHRETVRGCQNIMGLSDQTAQKLAWIHKK